MERVDLKYPIERDDAEPITTLVVRRPRLRDINAMNRVMKEAGASLADVSNSIADATDAASLAMATGKDVAPIAPKVDPGAMMAGAVAMIASMNGLDPDVLMDLDPDDFSTLQERLEVFTRPGPSGKPGA